MNDNLTPEKLAQLFNTHYAGLFNLLQRRLSNRELAADLLNEAAAITLEHVKSGRVTEPERIAGYVFNVAINLLWNHRKKVINKPGAQVSPELVTIVAQHEDGGVEAERIKRQVRELVASLTTPRDREIVRRFYLNEEDKEVICSDLKLTPLQFNQVIARARQRMRQLMDSKGLSGADFYIF